MESNMLQFVIFSRPIATTDCRFCSLSFIFANHVSQCLSLGTLDVVNEAVFSDLVCVAQSTLLFPTPRPHIRELEFAGRANVSGT